MLAWQHQGDSTDLSSLHEGVVDGLPRCSHPFLLAEMVRPQCAECNKGGWGWARAFKGTEGAF
jgi:hypothetical protein